jgi:cytochrome P450
VAFFNPFRPAYLEDPYPSLDRLRASEPVHWSADLGAWVVTSYAECLRVLQDDESFSSDPVNAAGEFGQRIARHRSEVPLGQAAIMGNSDPPKHDLLRAIVNRAFTPRAIENQRPALESKVSDLLEPAGQGAPFDIVSGLAEPLAVTSVLAYLGFPQESLEMVRGWSLKLMRARAEGAETPGLAEAAAVARDEMLHYLAMLADARDDSGEAAGDVLSVLIDAADEGALEPDEMLMMLIHISLAGNGPTAMAIANAAWVLAEHPAEQAWLRAHPERAPAAVEELLRFETATHFIARFALRDVAVGSRTIRRGQQVHAMLGAANRDPARFDQPDELRFERADNRQLAFGFGIHFCLGAPLARLELEVVLRGLLARFPTGFRVAHLERGGSYQVRGFQRLLVIAAPEG